MCTKSVAVCNLSVLNFPFSGQFFGSCIFILSAAAVCAAVTVNIHYRSPEKPIPYAVRLIFLRTLAPCVLVSVRASSDGENAQRCHSDSAKGQTYEGNDSAAPVLLEVPPKSNTPEKQNCVRRNEWHDLAETLDRIFLLAFAAIILVMSLVILTRRPEHVEKPWELWPNEAVFH